MPSRAATFVDVTVFNARAYGARDYRRSVFGNAILGLGGVSAAAVMAGTVAVAAAWMVSGSLARNPQFRASAPFALETAVLPSPPRRLADPTDMFGGALASANPAYAPDAIHEAEFASAASPALSPAADAAQLPSQRTAQLTGHVPLPLRRPRAFARAQIKLEMASAAPTLAAPPMTTEVQVASAGAVHLEAVHTEAAHAEAVSAEAVHAEAVSAEAAHSEAAPLHLSQKPLAIGEQKEIAALAFAASLTPETTGSIGAVGKPVLTQPTFTTPAPAKPPLPHLAYANPDTPPMRDSGTAIYDIVAHTVYMPDGERLEAHSGLGRMLDDPHYASQKGRGPTPPNTYDLTLRSGSFHGVQALRLNPAADSKMYGRDGILAHTYMLGPSGQSFGCVSFKNYSEFLRAFQRGEVKRLVVVPHLQSPPPGVRAEVDDGEHYAFNLEGALNSVRRVFNKNSD
jgi:Protein of unknown function (DUF2778)